MEIATQETGTKIGQLRLLYAFMVTRSFVAGRQELLEAGFTRHRIANWIRTGRLVKLVRGVYSYGRGVENHRAVWRAGLVAAGRGSALTGQSACEAWGFVETKDQLPRVVTVAVSRGGSRQLRGQSPALAQTVFRLVKRRFQPDEIRIKDGLAVVKPILALLDYAAEASERSVRFAFLEACRLKVFGRADVDDCFRRIVGHRGAGKLRPLLVLWVPELSRIRSVFEGLFLLAWMEAGFPMPKVNERIFGYEVDLFWAEYGVVLELDGGAFHNNPAQRAIDLAKQRDLEAQGLIVLRMTYEEFNADPAAAISRVLHRLNLR